MKLSIISIVSKDAENLKGFLKDLEAQSNKDFELILVMQKSSNTLLKVVENYIQNVKFSTKIITNYREQSYEKSMFEALRLVSGEYVTFISNNNAIKYNVVERFISDSEKHAAEIIEYKPRLVGEVKWKPKYRITPNKLFSDKEKCFVTFAFPFIFNKLFKNSVVEKVVSIKTNYSFNTEFAIELLYYLLINAKSYIYLDNRILRQQVDNTFIIKPNTFEKSWNNIETYLKMNNIKMQHEIDYAKAYYTVVLTPGMLSADKNRLYKLMNIFAETSKRHSQINLHKVALEINKYFINNLQNFAMRNIYMDSNLLEIKFLTTETKPENWNTILKTLNV